ncbi:MAG: hypothetical protein ABI406_19900 [Ktedonobacteraceae bacterium]
MAQVQHQQVPLQIVPVQKPAPSMTRLFPKTSRKQGNVSGIPPILFAKMTLDEALKDENLHFPSVQCGFWNAYGAALVLTARIIPFPIVVAFITALTYIAPSSGLPVIGSPDNLGVLVDGLAITLILWLIISLLCRGFTAFEVADAHSSSHIKRHLLALQSILLLIKEKIDMNNTNGDTHAASNSLASFRSRNHEDYDIALQCMYENVCGATNQLKNSDAQAWIDGNGYLKIWNFIHLAEEAMLNIAPREFVIREALHDEAAINGSDIALHDIVLSNIKTAVKKLSPSAAMYLKSLPAQDRNTPSDNGSNNHQSTTVATATILRELIMRFLSLFGSTHHSSSTTANGHEELDAVTEMEARNALRDARQMLNDFRATQWDGLVRLRNQIFGTSLFTASLTYTLLCAAIISGIDRSPLKAALFFYLVGATVGLFSRLYTERQSDSAIDDYGLAIARVTVTPVISGLAAIAGVLVVSYLSLNLLNTPGAPTNTGLPPMKTVYDLVQNQQGIIVSAIFGFAPNLFINVLQQKANDATAKLKNSTAPGAGN